MHRVPAGLTISMFVAAVSLGVLVVCWNVQWPMEPGLPLVAHVCAGLCFLWGVVSHFLARTLLGHTDRFGGRGAAGFSLRGLPTASGALAGPGTPRGLKPAAPPGYADAAGRIGQSELLGSVRTHRRDIQAVLEVAMLAAGLASVIIMIYAAITETLLRTIHFEYDSRFGVHIWPSGFVDLAAVACALVLGWRRTGQHALVTALFWLLVFAGLWASLQGPLVGAPSWTEAYRRSVATRWAGLFMVSGAVLVAVFTAVASGLDHRRRARAWPDALEDLTRPPIAWPGFRYSAGIVAMAILVLGCTLIAQPWTIVSGLLAGGAMLALAGRRWEENLADAGLALITLGVVSTCMVGLPDPSESPPQVRYAEIYNRALIGLAAMTFTWHWLAGVWEQQLDHGRPWTTAGRLLRTAQRVGYLIGATAILVSLYLSFWPRLPFVFSTDAHPWRWGLGLVANGSLIGALGWSAWRTGKATLAWLMVFAVASTAGFVLVRIPGSAIADWWALHWPVAMPAIAAAGVVLAYAAARSPARRVFREPLYLGGTLLAPGSAVAGIIMMDRLKVAPWVPSATFGSLAGVYLLAAILPGPRKWAGLAVVCVLVAIGCWR